MPLDARTPSRIACYYSPIYSAVANPMYARLAVAAGRIARSGTAAIEAPPAFDAGVLRGLHTDDYIDAFIEGREPLASSQGVAWSPAVRDATFAMLSGQLAGAARAMKDGVALNLARGFHHAVRERGSGFCAMNGLALVAHRLPGKSIVVIDCDEHGGNGTEEFSARLPNLFAISIFGTRFGCTGGARSRAFEVRVERDGFPAYVEALLAAADLVADLRPDLLLYQAGADCHRDDPKSLVKLSTRELFLRDLLVFLAARSLRIPILFLLAGGYQSAQKLSGLNANTLRAAHRVFSAARPAPDAVRRLAARAALGRLPA